ncbi:MAG: DUF4262 domain-containing protein [Bacteroidetes bacterium]|nr:DUF4262 domain-containing protein [Bacteroidota bacterium]
MKTHDKHHCIGKDELLEQTKRNIKQYGLQVVMVGKSDYLPSFAYSIGLWRSYNQPEVICFALGDELGKAIINDVADLIKNGEKIEEGRMYNNIFKGRATFLKIDERNTSDYFAAAIDYYGTEKFNALQLVWSDSEDRFPWEDGFEERYFYSQPLLDRNADFKFYEPKNATTFTTRQWLDQKQPILRVVHDTDGDWQFLTGDQLPGDICIVALEQMIKGDPTLNELWHLDYGRAAERTHIGGAWTITEVEEEIEEDIEE